MKRETDWSTGQRMETPQSGGEDHNPDLSRGYGDGHDDRIPMTTSEQKEARQRQQANELHDAICTSVMQTLHEVLLRGCEKVEGGFGDLVRRHGGPRTAINPPPPFDGTRPREWLQQIEHYYEVLGLQDEMRVKNVFTQLTGPALSHYCMARSDGVDPKTWGDFKEFILERFSYRGVGETLRRLRTLRWEGSLDRLAARFNEVLAHGVPPPQVDLVRLFVARVLLHMLANLPNKSVTDMTWTQVKRALEQANASMDQLTDWWLTNASPDLLRLAESTPHLLPPEFRKHRDQRNHPPAQPKGGSGAQDPRRRQQLSGGERSSGDTICSGCGGVGHRARQCPSTNEETKRDGATCNRRRGLEHWARHCPTRRAMNKDYSGEDNKDLKGPKPTGWKGGSRQPQHESGNDRA